MSVRQVRVALRCYLRPVFVRENRFVIACMVLGLLVAARFGYERHFVQAHGLAAVFHHGFSRFVMMWWLLAWLTPSCITSQYWRQVSTELSMAVPGLLEAEYRAVLIVLPIGAIALASPLIALGAPIIGSIAVASLAMVGGTHMPRITGQSRRRRVVLTLLMSPLIFIYMAPGVIGAVLLGPQAIALALLIIALGMIGATLRYFPARAQSQIESTDQQREGKADQQFVTPRNTPLAVIGRVLRWQPRPWRQDPVPRTLKTSMGPVGWVVYYAAGMAFLIGLGILLRAAHGPLSRAVHTSTRMAVTQMPMFAVLYSGSWLMSRADWPLLYLAGRNGTRRGFARALFRAHRRTAVQSACAIGLVTLLALAAVTSMSVGTAVVAGVSIAALIFGLGYVVATPLLWNEIGGRGMNMAMTFLAALLAVVTIAAGFVAHGLTVWFPPVALAVAAAGLAVEPVLARRLASIDWLIETETSAV